MAVARKVPIKEVNGVNVSFVWKDSIQKGNFLTGPPKVSKLLLYNLNLNSFSLQDCDQILTGHSHGSRQM